MRVTVADGMNKLPETTKAPDDGKAVSIGAASASTIVRTKKPAQRTLGTLRGKIKILDPNWWKPMTDGKTESSPHSGRHTRRKIQALPGA